jgi:hypothetical protein
VFYGEFPLQYWGDGTNENLSSQFFDYRLSAQARFVAWNRIVLLRRKGWPEKEHTMGFVNPSFGEWFNECEDTLSDIGGVWYQLLGVEDAFHLAHSSCPRTL